MSMRARLALASSVLALAIIGASFFALHERTGTELRSAIDERLRADLAEFHASPAARATTPTQLAKRGRKFVESQGYHTDSRIFVISAVGEPTVTNESELVSEEHGEGEAASEREDESGAGADSSATLLGAPDGLATIDLTAGGVLRVLTEPVVADGRDIGSFRVAESLDQVGFAQRSLRNTLLVVGGAALVILVLTTLWIATLTVRPLRRMTDFAAVVDTDDLDDRFEAAGPDEVRSLAGSFNRMLDRLQAAFERERQFVANASHELRTPVTIVHGELELARREARGEQRERLDSIHRELRRMERLIDEMLALAAQESGAALRRERVAVSDVLADVRRDAPLLGARHYFVDDLEGTVEADPDRLAQVFRNVIANAVAHTGSDDQIHVSAGPRGDAVRFSVRDSGPGFAPGEAARVFDRFYRTDDARARHREGSGLGLAIARAIVEAHGGRIWAETDAGRGATISFELPGYRPDNDGVRRSSTVDIRAATTAASSTTDTTPDSSPS
jgi:signal transduction histidine kinase